MACRADSDVGRWVRIWAEGRQIGLLPEALQGAKPRAGSFLGGFPQA